jgi:hypothetical protein
MIRAVLCHNVKKINTNKKLLWKRFWIFFRSHYCKFILKLFSFSKKYQKNYKKEFLS